MGVPTAVSAGSKWLILTVILIVVAFGFAIASWTGVFFPREQFSSPERVEKIYFDSAQWSEASCDLYVANTGADELVISKVWINGTLLDSEEWESFPSMLLKPGDQGVLKITPSSITFTSGTAYKFTVETSAGTSFSHTATAEWQTQQAGALLVKENVSWPNSNTINIVIRNTGTASGRITAVYIGTTSSNLTSASVASPSLPANINEGSTLTITLTQSWSSGTRYYFKIATDTAAILEFSERSP